MAKHRSEITMHEISDPAELAQARRQREQFDLNSAWLQAHIHEVYTEHRGKHICIAGQRLFVADEVEEAVAQALAACAEDLGWFTRYIPREKVARIYAC